MLRLVRPLRATVKRSWGFPLIKLTRFLEKIAKPCAARMGVCDLHANDEPVTSYSVSSFLFLFCSFRFMIASE